MVLCVHCGYAFLFDFIKRCLFGKPELHQEAAGASRGTNKTISSKQSTVKACSNFLELKNGEYREEIRLLMHKEKSKNWPRLTDYATFVMNNRECGKIGYSPSDIFFGHRTWRLEMPFAHAGNQDLESWIQEPKRLAQTVLDQLRRKRTTRHKYLNRKRTAAKYLV